MHRVLELVRKVRAQFLDDRFFFEFESSCHENRLKREFYLSYEKVFGCLDEESWEALKLKALLHFMDHRPGQWKAGFFNQLNEAFAYRYLVSIGCTNVVFLPEKKKSKQPDLGFSRMGAPGLCEVKSISISDDEIQRRNSHEYIDGSVYATLSPGFMNKLKATIGSAETQISALPESSIIYVVIEFDDFMQDYQAEYRSQLQAFLSKCQSNNLILQVGRFGYTINA